MLNLQDEKKRLAELEAEWKQKEGVFEYGWNETKGRALELRRIVELLEEVPDETLMVAIKRDIQNIGSIYRTVGQALWDEPVNRLAERIATTVKRMENK